ncbi:MAG: InlB B-repeat-containing protein, partial [Clostridia bacterium]|jgi:hypothetical protein|nr:InlB B-repeat-containing protein [Clostridia bacterium]
MKKLGSMIITIGLILCSLMSGCSYYYNIDKKFISDGDFKYYYIEDRDCYAIADLTEQGNEKRELYMPPYFKGKEVKYTSFYRSSLVGLYEHTFYAPNAEKVFFSYMSDYYDSVIRLFGGTIGDILIPKCESNYIEKAWFSLKYETILFVNIIGYNYLLEKLIDTERIYYLSIGDYIVNEFNSNGEVMRSMHIANTSYMFNYEGSPNEGYFFINDFERGGEIEDTPYEPTREGYIFGGWYKEPECKNVWDFGADTLPDAEYDEEGVLIFRETQLYAKWIKN